jgi:glycosyltransferase involved in cell wall biosynthesis
MEAGITEKKPLATFAMLVYNQEEYIREAVQAAFDQTYSPLEIIISDDCSKDGTFRIVEEMAASYTGPHKIICSRNQNNLGIAEHVNKVNRMAQGELIVLAAGDDISVPERTEKLVGRYLRSEKTAHYLFSLARKIDVNGQLLETVNSPGAPNANDKWKAAFSPYPIAIGATEAWTKQLAEFFSPLGKGVWAEDQVFGLRGLLLGKVDYIDEPLVLYRVGSGVSTTARKFSMRRYFKGKIANAGIYWQRHKDLRHSGNRTLAVLVALKAIGLVLLMPIDPLLSSMKKLGRT